MTTENHNQPDVQLLQNVTSGAERSDLALCLECGADLTGKRDDAKFCSDRCRTNHRRDQQNKRASGLISSLEDLATHLTQIVSTLKTVIEKGGLS